MSSPAAIALPVIVHVSSDEMTVQISLRTNAAVKALDAAAIIAHLTQLGVKLTPRSEAEVQEFCRPRKRGHAALPVIVATGSPPVDDVPPYLVLIDPVGYAVGVSRQVKIGDPIATLVSREPGRDGVNVYGKPVARRQAEVLPVVDASLVPAADGHVYHAAIDGVVRVRGTAPLQTISVLPCLRHTGDIALTVPPTHFRSIGEIAIDGDVCGATLKAGGDIQITGDMMDSSVSGEADFCAQRVEQSTVDITGDCSAATVSQSRIACGEN